jgi:hypothetical protein
MHKNKFWFLPIATTFFLCSCVQKAFDKTVVFQVVIPQGPADIDSNSLLKSNCVEESTKVGIRGDNRPLSWRQDSLMRAVVPDSLYECIITFHTGYQFAEVKFVVDGNFEFQNQDNRRVNFSPSDTTFYRAVYNVR